MHLSVLYAIRFMYKAVFTFLCCFYVVTVMLIVGVATEDV